MVKLYEIRTLQDIADLTPEQQPNFIADLVGWLAYVNNANIPEGFKIDKSQMIWRDDGDYGSVHQVVMNPRYVP